jgi:hypothetical protein
MNDKIKKYINDEGEFLIPFEQIQRGKRPHKQRLGAKTSAWYFLWLFAALWFVIMCGLCYVVMLIAA